MSHALIIDDNRNNIDVLIMMLEQEGISQTSVQNLSHIETTLEQMDSVDVVFLDLEFPGSNGFELLKLIRSLAPLAQAQVIAYTVHTSEIDAVRRAGFDGFLGKPLDSRRFSSQVKRILSGASVWEI